MSKPVTQARKVHPTVRATERVEELLPELFHHKEDGKAAKRMEGTSQTELLKLYAQLGIKEHVVETDGGVLTGTRGQGHTTELDEEGLRDAISKALWLRITTRHIDQDLLKAAVARGDIDVALIESLTTVKDKSPYIVCTFNAGATISE